MPRRTVPLFLGLEPDLLGEWVQRVLVEALLRLLVRVRLAAQPAYLDKAAGSHIPWADSLAGVWVRQGTAHIPAEARPQHRHILAGA